LRATQSRCARIAARTAVDAVAVWEWGLLERVGTAFVCLDEDHAMRQWAHDAFAVAEACVGAGP
jgi:hypothetical protein